MSELSKHGLGMRMRPCPKCGRKPSVATCEQRLGNPGDVYYVTRMVHVCRPCRMVRYHLTGDVGQWHDIFAVKCVVCEKPVYNWSWFSEPHECPKSVEAGRKGADNTDYVARREPSLHRRLEDGFTMLEGS